MAKNLCTAIILHLFLSYLVVVHSIFSKKQVKTYPHYEIKNYGITFDSMDGSEF